MSIDQARIDTLKQWASEYCEEGLSGDYELLKITTDPDDEFMKRGWQVAVVLKSTLRDYHDHAVLRLWDGKAENISKKKFQRELLDATMEADSAATRKRTGRS